MSHVEQKEAETRAKIEALLAKPNIPADDSHSSGECFDPWEELFPNIYGFHNSEMDVLFIEGLKAVRDHRTFEYSKNPQFGLGAELVMYILAGHDLTEYGTSPRGGRAMQAIEDLWQPLIDRWIEYFEIYWDMPYPHK